MPRTKAVVEPVGDDKPEPYRPRLNIPGADVSTIEWMRLQDDLNASLQDLVRAEIARNGMRDIRNYPVVQLPRRGRPAGNAGTEDDVEEQEVVEEPAVPQVTRKMASVSPEPVQGQDDEDSFDPAKLFGHG